MLHLFFKIKTWIDTHSGTIDLAIGGSIGAGTGVTRYWEHFKNSEHLFKLYDGIFDTCVHTIEGAILLWAIHRFILKKNK